MPNVIEQDGVFFAHCEDSQCPGNEQQAGVAGVRRITEFRCRDLGGDSNLIERTAVQLHFAVAAEQDCGHCGKRRVLTDQKRPVYPSNGYDPDGLMKLIRDGKLVQPGAKQQDSGADERVAALEAKLAQQTELLTALLAGQQGTQGPVEEKPARGRPVRAKE